MGKEEKRQGEGHEQMNSIRWSDLIILIYKETVQCSDFMFRKIGNTSGIEDFTRVLSRNFESRFLVISHRSSVLGVQVWECLVFRLKNIASSVLRTLFASDKKHRIYIYISIHVYQSNMPSRILKRHVPFLGYHTSCNYVCKYIAQL